MIGRLISSALLVLAAGCSDPLDDEPKGQTIPTHADLSTGYAAGSGAAGRGMPRDTGMAAPVGGGKR
jgi:hypothetical protein